MPPANKYFDDPLPAAELPELRALKGLRNRPGVRSVRVDVAKRRDGLVLLEPRIRVLFLGDDPQDIRESLLTPWDPELEAWLIDEQHARAISVTNEKDRFSLLLKPALQPAVVRYGDGYFNSVLIHTLAEGPYRDDPEVADVLRSIREYPPAGGSLYDCREFIEKAFASAARRLMTLYPSERDLAVDILAGAIARYLDDRFSVTNSRLLGFSD